MPAQTRVIHYYVCLGAAGGKECKVKMQIVGYMILLVFYLCYFIKMFQQRKQGIQTDHMGKGKQGIQKKIEIMGMLNFWLENKKFEFRSATL